MRWVLATVAIGILGAAQWAVQSAPPTEAVLVVRHNLAPGHILAPSDISIGEIPVPAGRGARLLPASLEQLVAGEYLTAPALAGSPLLTTQITRVRRDFKALVDNSGGDSCLPTKAV